MKKLKFLFLAPAVFAMVACGGVGKEVTVEKAKELAKGMKDVEQPKDYEVVIEMTSYDAEDKSTTKTNYTLKQNSNGDIYAAMKSNTEGGSSENAYNMDVEAYRVKNDTYEEVLYMKSYDEDEKKDEVQVVVKKDNETAYSYAGAQVDYEIGSLSVYLTGSDELEAAIDAAEKQAKDDENLEVKYYSKGDKNLTIKETMKETDDEKAQFGESSITFDKGLLTETTTKLSDKAGNKLEMKITCKYPKSVKIELPSGWESYLEAE